MVSFVEILKRLTPGDYATMSGAPDARERFEEFVREVREKVPELRNRDDREVENAVIAAVEWAIDNICKPLRSREFAPTPDHYEGVGLFECNHPETGRFYIVLNEELDSTAAFGYYGFTLTRNKKDALSKYRIFAKDIAEREKEAGESEW